MWEFPNGCVDVGQDPAQALRKVIKSGYRLTLRAKRKVRQVGTFQHAYTHFKVTVEVFESELNSGPIPRNLRWIPLNKLNEYPMGRLDRQIAESLKQ